MFAKLSLVTLVTPLLARALTLNIPTNPTSSATVHITWTTAPNDPERFTIELSNESFHNSFAIANNVLIDEGSIDIPLPSVPVGAGYTLQAVDVGNINNVFSTTGQFSVAANPASTGVSTSTTSSAATATASTSTATGATSTRTSVPISITSTSVATGTATRPTTSGTGTSTGASTGTNTVSSPAASTTSAAGPALKIGNVGALAAIFFSAVAGAAVFVL